MDKKLTTHGATLHVKVNGTVKITTKAKVNGKQMAGKQLEPLSVNNVLMEIKKSNYVGTKSPARGIIVKNNVNIVLTPSQMAPRHSDSGISNTSSNELNDNCEEDTENMPPKEIQKSTQYSCQINDYVNDRPSEQDEAAGSTLVVSEAPSVNTREFDKMLRRELKPKALTNFPETTVRNSTPPPSHNQLARINRDINSPSASVRLRAIKALNCPAENHYQLFDVAHTEEDIITEEERNPPARPSLEELMRNIKVYVEVRSGEDNRSAGIKKVIAAMGAHVNDKLLRDTTHVIFKDGLMSTYRKAKNWNIPIVSILWIEACKLQQRICPAKDFSISNLDRYENPEYYEKMKRVKPMQPDSESKIRVRVKPATPKDTNSKTQVASSLPKRLGTAGSANRTPSATHISKTATDNSNGNGNANTAGKATNNMTRHCENVDSPATQFLKKIESGCITPAGKSKSVLVEAKTNERKDTVVPTSSEMTNKVTSSQSSLTRRTLYSAESQDKQLDSRPKPAESRVHLRRRSTMNITKSTYVDMSLDTTLLKEVETCEKQEEKKEVTKVTGTQRRQSSRRKTLHFNTAISPEKEKKVTSPSKKRGQRRRTTYAEKPIEIEESPGTLKAVDTTDYAPQVMEVSKLELAKKDEQCMEDLCASLSTTRIPEQPLASSTMHVAAEEEVQDKPIATTEVVPFDSARKPGRRRTLFDVSMDIISERLQNINRSARRSTLLPTIVDETSETTPTAKSQQAIKECEEATEEQATIENSSGTPTVTSSGTSTDTLTKKKRKLFAPNNSLVLVGTPPLPKPVPTDKIAATSVTLTPPLVQKKRRRTLMPCSQPCTSTSTHKNAEVARIPSTAEKPQRRSTMDFDMGDRKLGKADKANKPEKPRPSKFMVHTNMHKEQKDIIAKALKKLGMFGLENIVSERTTHVVSLEPRRTMNLLRGLTKGLWILEYKWVTDSVEAGHWLEEEPYELKDFSNAIEICRSERQAFGSAYSCELFATMGAFYVSISCGSVNKTMLAEFIKLGGGQLTESRCKAKYIICDIRNTMEDKIHITPKWVLDSITQMQLQPHSKYQPVFKGHTNYKPAQPMAHRHVAQRFMLKYPFV